MNAPPLEYVALVVEDPQQTADFFANDLGLPREDRSLGSQPIPIIGIGDSALALFAPGHEALGDDSGKGVHHMAVGARDPVQAARQCGLATEDGAPVRRGLDNRAEVVLPHDQTCGVRTRFIEPLNLAQGSSNMVERIDHLGIASVDNQAAKRVFIDGLGCVYESQQTDSEFETLSENFTSDVHPNVFHTRPTRLRGSLRVTFITVGDCELEFLQDLTVGEQAEQALHDSAGTTLGDRSAIARFIARRGQGLHHIALKTPDIDRVLGKLRESGYRLIDTTGRPGSRRARIGFVHPASVGGVLVHFVQREEV